VELPRLALKRGNKRIKEKVRKSGKRKVEK